MTLSTLIAVAAGGAAGAVGRYLMMSAVGHLAGPGFPWGTLVVNVAGSIAMGVLIELLALVWSPPAEVRALLVVGFLGAFTTFSTFSLDAWVLIERGEVLAAAGYVAASVLLCIGGLVAGLHAARAVLT